MYSAVSGKTVLFFTPFSGGQGRCAEMKKKYSRLSRPGVFVVGLFLSLCLLLAGCQLGGSTGTSGGTGLQQSTSSCGSQQMSFNVALGELSVQGG
jgi:hypothetical protein